MYAFQSVTPHIWRMQLWYTVMPVNVWLVREDDGWTLIDAGAKPHAEKLIRAILTQLNGWPLQRIALTHGHVDHAGSLLALTQAFPNAQVICHREEAPFVTGEKRYADLHPDHRSYRLAPKFPPQAPGVHFTQIEDGDLVGSMYAVYTPGHTPGHVAYWHQIDNAIICGDTFLNILEISPPLNMFSSNLEGVQKSINLIGELNFAHLLPSHGNPILNKGRTQARRLR